MKKQIGNMLWVSAGVVFSLYGFADPNPYTMFGADNSGQSGSVSAAPSMQSVSSAPTAPASNTAAPATAAPAATSAAASKYQTPAPLVQPAGNVGQSASSSSTAKSSSTKSYAPLPLSSAQTSLNPSVSLAPAASSTINTAPANYSLPNNYSTYGGSTAPVSPSGAGITPASGGDTTDILQQIDKDIQLSNTQIANRFTTEDALNYPSPAPTSLNPNLLQTDMGFVGFASGLNSNQLGASSASGNGAVALSAISIANPLVGVPVVISNLNALYQSTSSPSSSNASSLPGSVTAGPSVMTLLNQAVTSPFVGNWTTDLSNASTPQLLRVIAMQQAIQNYILYQQLNRMSEQEALQVQTLQAVLATNQGIAGLQQSSGSDVPYLKQMITLLQENSAKTKNQ
jgi:hypothetical protein